MKLLLQHFLTGILFHITTAFLISGIPEYISDFTNHSISEIQLQPYRIHTSRLISASHIFTAVICPKDANITEIEFIPAIDSDQIVLQFWRKSDSNSVQLIYNVTLNSEQRLRDKNGVILSSLPVQITCTENWMLGTWINNNVYPFSLIFNSREQIPDSTYLTYTSSMRTRIQPSINQQYVLNTEPHAYRSYPSGHFLAVKIHFQHDSYIPPSTPTTTTSTTPTTIKQSTTTTSTTQTTISMTTKQSTVQQEWTTTQSILSTGISQEKIAPVTTKKVQITPDTTTGVQMKSELKLTFDGWILPVIIAVSSAVVLAIIIIIVILCIMRHNRRREAEIERFKAENGLPMKANSDLSKSTSDYTEPTTLPGEDNSQPPGYSTAVYTQAIKPGRSGGHVNESFQYSENECDVNFGTFKRSPGADNVTSTLNLTENEIYMSGSLEMNDEYSDLPPPASSLYENDFETCITKC